MTLGQGVNQQEAEIEAELGLELRHTNTGCGYPKQHFNHCTKFSPRPIFLIPSFFPVLKLTFLLYLILLNGYNYNKSKEKQTGI